MTISALGTALVTGASTGIGAVYADRLARRGYDLILVARNRERLQEVSNKLGEETGRSIRIEVADLTKADDLGRIDKLLGDDASITLLVNNAGSTLPGGLLGADAPVLSILIALNVTAPTVLASAAGKAFKARGRGAIINVASTIAFAPDLYEGREGLYSATKTYILSLSQSFAAHLKDAGVHVQAVLPGVVRTPIWEKAGRPVENFPQEMVMEAGDLVDAALIGFDRGEAITLPTFSDETLWKNFEEARAALLPEISSSRPAARYRTSDAA